MFFSTNVLYRNLLTIFCALFIFFHRMLWYSDCRYPHLLGAFWQIMKKTLNGSQFFTDVVYFVYKSSLR